MTAPDHASREPDAPLPPAVIQAFRRGERAAFLVVYERCAQDVRALVARYLRSPFEREEAVQEIWLNVHQVASQYDPTRGALRPWLLTVAANRCLQLLRAARRRPAGTLPVSEDELVAPADPQREADEARVRAAVARFAQRLEGEERSVWQLAFVEGRRQDEVARQLGISVRRYKYVKKKLLDQAAAAPELKGVLDEVLA